MKGGQNGNNEGPYESKINSSNEILKNQGQEKEKPISTAKQQLQQKQKEGILTFMMDFMHLYKFGERKDKLLMVFGVLIALASGVTFPLFTYFWGKETDHINIHYANLSQSLDTSLYYYLAIIITGVVAFLIDGIAFSIWKLLSVSIARKFRVNYLTAFSKKSIKWIEKENLYEFSSKFKTNCLTIEKAIGDKVALFYNLQGIMLSGTIAALCVRWTFTLYLFALLPIVLGVLGSFLYVIIKKKMLEKEFYKKAEAQTIEVMSLIKTVKMLGNQEHESAKFKQKLEEYANNLKGEPLRLGLATGLFYFIQYLMYGIGFMYAIQCVRGTSACPVSITGSHYTMGDTLTVFFELFLCSYNFLQLATNFESIKGAIECSKEIFKFVDEAQQQQVLKRRQLKQQANPESTHFKEFGKIQFKDVFFSYPLNQQKTILQGLSMQFLKNKFNAIAGPTGSGKSTIIQLLLKYYSPTSGHILVDGEEIQKFDENVLRNQIGYVGQEPTLFSGTIRDNIKVGKDEATDDEIFDILKKVNIYDFVVQQKERLDFEIGFGGSKLSGGQRQRLSVARALIRNPSVLILDEATSALDRKSERIIQETIQTILEKDRNITIICIAHRLKTISAADKIWYIEDGKVKKEGKIEDIEQLKYKMESQQISSEQQNSENIQTTTALIDNSSNQKENNRQESTDNGQEINIYSRLFQFISIKRWYYIGIVAAIFNGLNHPAGAVILTYMYDTLIREANYGFKFGWCENSPNPTECQGVLDDYHSRAVKILLGMIGFAFYAFFPYFVQFTLMSKLEDEITIKVRAAVFDKLMVLPIEWHERDENEGGKAASRCSVDAKQVGGLLTNYIPILVSNFCTIGGSIIISLCYNWRLGLLSLFATPFIAIAAYISMIFIGGYDDETLHKYQDSDQMADELIMSIRTLLSFNYQQRLIEKYEAKLTEPFQTTLKLGTKIGLMFGSSVMVFAISVGSLLYSGANILANSTNIDSIEFVILFTVPVWSGWVAGNNFFYASHANAGKASAKSILRILDLKSQSELQKASLNPIKAIPENFKGKIEFRNVSFRYGRGNRYVLSNVNLVIQAGEKAAFVGPSGCGKTTVMQLLQRFYQYEGEILLDDVNIQEYDLKQYRELFGVVSQQPNLFMGTLRQNVVADKQAGQDQEIAQVCRLALAYDLKEVAYKSVSDEKIFEFLEKEVGPKGSKISGGQKQRVALARALLRRPQLFLMDEGTSALDRETEKHVQENLDLALRGRTTISIAHRIETIENSDIIFLFEGGQVREQGKYVQLMKKKSSFKKFVSGKE